MMVYVPHRLLSGGGRKPSPADEAISQSSVGRLVAVELEVTRAFDGCQVEPMLLLPFVDDIHRAKKPRA